MAKDRGGGGAGVGEREGRVKKSATKRGQKKNIAYGHDLLSKIHNTNFITIFILSLSQKYITLRERG